MATRWPPDGHLLAALRAQEEVCVPYQHCANPSLPNCSKGHAHVDDFSLSPPPPPEEEDDDNDDDHHHHHHHHDDDGWPSSSPPPSPSPSPPPRPPPLAPAPRPPPTRGVGGARVLYLLYRRALDAVPSRKCVGLTDLHCTLLD